MAFSRQLAAIMFADIKGYTALMQEDEQLALEIRNKFETSLHNVIAAHSGRILKIMGDGALCLFASSIEAVKAALAIQIEMRNSPKVPLRIGIHTGDVAVDETDVYGDGVNVASRVESFAVPGGIFISAKVYDDIKNHKDIQAVSLGAFTLKNVKEQVEIFAISNEGLAMPQNGKLQGKGHAPAKSRNKALRFRWLAGITLICGGIFLAFKLFAPSVMAASTSTKSIAILPFRNESLLKGENEYFCNGMMEAVLNNLSQIKSFHVISRQSVEQYRDSKKTIGTIADELGVSFILSGSVQRIGNKVKITAQLIDAGSDQQIWSNNFTGQLDDVFSLQENIAGEIASALQVKIAPDVESRLARVPSTNQKALDLYYEAQTIFAKQAFLLSQHDSDYNNIQLLCTKAILLDPSFAEAYVLKAKTYWNKKAWNSFRIKIKETELLDSVALPCEKALAMNKDAVEAMVLLSDYNSYLGNKEIMFTYLEKAIAINPNNVDANLRLSGYYMVSDTTSEKSFHYLFKAVRLDPQSATTPTIYVALLNAYLNICDFDKAKNYAEKAIQQNINVNAKAEGFRLMAVIYSRIGSGDDVIRYANEALKYDDHALYFAAEGYCYLNNDCAKAVQLYDYIWKKYPDQDNKQRYAVALWKTGKKDEAILYAKQALDRIKTEDSLGKVTSVRYDVAGIYAFLGIKKAAYEILHQPASNVFVWSGGLPYFILRDPLFENLWNEKEFKDIVARVQGEKTNVRERIRLLEQQGQL